jgi:hypothetical protein
MTYAYIPSAARALASPPALGVPLPCPHTFFGGTCPRVPFNHILVYRNDIMPDSSAHVCTRSLVPLNLRKTAAELKHRPRVANNKVYMLVIMIKFFISHTRRGQ